MSEQTITIDSKQVIQQVWPTSGAISRPAVVCAGAPTIDAISWASQNLALIDELLCARGAILFRGFGIGTIETFERFAGAMCDELYGEYGDLPPKEGAKRAYRSTPYPESEMILFHNESSHLDKWPRKQWFYCELPSVKGGATPLVDCRQILEHIPPAFSERLAIEGLLYIRTFTDGLDVRWQDFFHTEDRQTAEQVCRAAGMDCLWLGDDDLQMTNLSPAVIEHPITQQRALFNQIQLHHPFFLAPDLREYLLSMVGEDRLPRNVRYGGGEPIEVENLRALSEAYDACAVRFSWAEGDVVLLDNMLTAHARDPYEGQRKIVVAMGEMVPSRAYCAKFKTEAI